MSNTKTVSDFAYVLHSVPYKETSLIVELFCKEYGRLTVIAKGARRPYSRLRAVLVSFQPLQVCFTGKSEVKILTQADWMGGLMPPDGQALFAAYYLNELLMHGLSREDAHHELFSLYQKTLVGLVHGEALNLCLRQFEIGLLHALGWGLDWRCDADGVNIDSNRAYLWVEQHGWVLDGGELSRFRDANAKQLILGKWIIEVQQGQCSQAAAHALKPTMRQLLTSHVVPNGLMSRVWMEHLLRHD